MKLSKDYGVKRFIYASSSSVYGIKYGPNVHEDLPLEPLTDYSKYKAMCEEVLMKERAPGFTTLWCGRRRYAGTHRASAWT